MFKHKYARRMPMRHTHAACYRSDAADPMETAIELLDDKMKEYKSSFENKVDPRFTQIEEAIRELKARGGRIPAFSHNSPRGLRALIARGINEGITERKSEIIESSNPGSLMHPYEIKSVANISTSNLATDSYQSYIEWQPGMEPTGQFHFRNLTRTVISDTDLIQFPRANVPIGEGSFSRVAEGNTKPQVDRDFTMVALTLTPMAAYTITSRASLRNIVFLQSWLPTSLLDQMEDSEDTDFANKLVAAATGSTSTTKTVLPEKLLAYMMNLIKAKFNPTAIVVDPAVWLDLLVYQPSSSNVYNLPGPVTVGADGNIRILNKPIYPVNWLTGRRIIVGDWSKAAIVQSEGLRLRQSDSHASIMITNEILFLLERTENLAIYRPDAFITTTV